jgi:hypothetical protein
VDAAARQISRPRRLPVELQETACSTGGDTCSATNKKNIATADEGKNLKSLVLLSAGSAAKQVRCPHVAMTDGQYKDVIVSLIILGFNLQRNGISSPLEQIVLAKRLITKFGF